MPPAWGVYDTFVVRLYSRQGVLVYGEVVHVGTQRRQRFTALETLVTFIAAQLDARERKRAGDNEEHDEETDEEHPAITDE